MARVRVGQPARLELAGLPGRAVKGRVQFLYPSVSADDAHAARARRVREPERRPAPGHVRHHAPGPAGGGGAGGPGRGGRRHRRARTTCSSRRTAAASSPARSRSARAATATCEIPDGVAEGETVVTTANFLVDSESRLRAAIEGDARGAGPWSRRSSNSARATAGAGAGWRRGRALGGVGVAIQNLKLDAIPDLSDPQVIVFTEWMGRSPTLVEDQVTYPIVSKLIGTPARHRRARLLDVRHVVRLRHLRGGHRHLLGAQPRARVPERPARQRCPRASTPTLGPDATGIGWVFQYALVDKTRQARPRRAAHVPGLHAALRARQRARRRRGRERRRLPEAVPGHRRSDAPARLRRHARREVSDAIRASNNDVGGRILEFSGREYYVRGRGYITSLGASRTIARARAAGRAGTPLLVKDVGHGALRPRHPPRPARVERRGRGGRRRSSSCATARTRSTSSSA